ncbi:MAG: DUF4299 family protein [Candidatus Dojkabacteria bacterium]|nr:DUF4299 family protein [Candidatus Dojkabacteria bacterium]MDQ7021118.1 DUF4299 family protein [Candidatus Dojkabacteria bacterium]
MSYSFSVQSKTELPLEKIIEGISIENLKHEQFQIGDLQMPISEACYIEGVSTRAVLFTYEKGIYNVRILIFSSPEDYQVAFTLIKNVARLTNAEIESEEGLTVSLENFDNHFNIKWIERKEHAYFNTIKVTSREDGGMSQSDGYKRTFYYGEKMFKHINKLSNDLSTQYDFFINRMRDIQNIENKGISVSNIQRFKHIETGEIEGLVIWDVNEDSFLPYSNYIGIRDEKGKPFKFDYNLLEEFREELKEIVRLDEKQFVIMKINTGELIYLIEKIKELSNLGESNEDKKKGEDDNNEMKKKSWFKRIIDTYKP